jgi:hypothetical protein
MLMRLDEVRRDADGLGVVGDRLVGATAPLELGAEVDVRDVALTGHGERVLEETTPSRQ